MTRLTRWPVALVVFIALAPLPGQAQDAAPPKQDVTLLGQPKADYAARRKALAERVAKAAIASGFDSAVILVRGGSNQQLEDFEEGRFRQKNDFAYLTGVEVPGAAIVLKSTGEAALYLPPKTGPSFFSHQIPCLGPGSEAESHYGIESTQAIAKLTADLVEAMSSPKVALYALNPNPRPGDDRPDAKAIRSLKERLADAKFQNVAPFLADLRKIKSPAELELLQKAIDITGEANERIMARIRPDLFEYQLEAKVLDAFLDGGAMRPGFASIIGSGPNGTIPHYFANDRKMKDGELVVVDIGAEFHLYTADITRTYPVNGKFTPRQRELYQLVLDAQTEAAKNMKPGQTRLGMMTGFVSNYLRQSPLRAKDDAGNEHTMDRFFIHGLSHYLGMDVHDVGNIGVPMQVGEVFTIEPGLYIRSENIGIRIEDDYLMTEKGPEKLSKNIASTPDEIEAKIEKARAAKQ